MWGFDPGDIEPADLTGVMNLTGIANSDLLEWDATAGVFVPVAPSGGGGSGSTELLAVAHYAPASDTVVVSAGSAASLTAIDTTNAKITFTAPTNGKVRIRVEALSIHSTSGVGRWGLLNANGGATMAGPATVVGTLGGNGTRYSCTFQVTGLTASTSYTFQWAYAVSGGTHNIYAGGGSSTSKWGPLSMEAWSIP